MDWSVNAECRMEHEILAGSHGPTATLCQGLAFSSQLAPDDAVISLCTPTPWLWRRLVELRHCSRVIREQRLCCARHLHIED